MGYNSFFSGEFKTNKPVENWFLNYINRFSAIRHVARDAEKIKEKFSNWEKLSFNGDIGPSGAFFIGHPYNDETIRDFNYSGYCPGLWCHWMMPDSWTLKWDECPKFYDYIDWIRFLINNFFSPAGYILNGKITWEGEDEGDIGTIEVYENIVLVTFGKKNN